MRKLKLQMQITVDGFVAGSQGQLDWMTPESDERQVRYLQELTASIDLILLGRKMAEESIPHWENVAKSQSQEPEVDYARTFVATPKIIFSRTLQNIQGDNTRIEKGDLKQTVTSLKNQNGKNIIVYGGANFVSELIKHDLIDEFYLLVNPVSIGNGKGIFNQHHKLQLTKSTSFNNGVVLNHYAPGR